MNFKDDLKSVFEQTGVFISDEDLDEELILDSLQYLSLIVAIENYYSIEVEDSRLSKLKTFNDFFDMVESLVKKN